jgi:poly(A) polymerase
VMDAWNHTLDVLNRLESLLELLSYGDNPDKAENLTMGLVALYLGRYRKQLVEHMGNSLNPDRPHRGLLFLAGFYHDVGKKSTQSMEADGKIRFLGHDQAGGRLAEKRGQELRLSKQEIDRLVAIISHHMRPSLLSHGEEKPSRKSIYHFFRDTGVAGVDICLLSLADVLATYGVTLPQERWIRHLEVIQTLLGAWWEAREERVFPVPLINGEELMQTLDLVPGPQVGYLLEAIREAQITLEIHDQQEAINLARKIIRESINKKTG